MKRWVNRSVGKLCGLVVLAVIYACGGGGGGGGGGGAPKLFVSPASHDFGTVTTGNAAQPLSVTVRNDGRGDLGVSSIALSDATHFTLSPGTCGTSITLRPGNSCTVAVDFQPAAGDSQSATLNIDSNDPDTPTFALPLQGILQPITSLNVKINQLDACPRPGPAVAYVSVLDQGGFPINGLGTTNFQISEDPAGINNTLSSVVQVEGAGASSVAIVMDYSTSITHEPVDVQRMADAAVAFVQQLGADDEAEIIKFADISNGNIAVTPFTNDKAALVAGIRQQVTGWEGTSLFSAIVRAVEDTAARPADRRKAIIVVSDGRDTRSHLTLPPATRPTAISAANAAGIPVFTIALGIVSTIGEGNLRVIADETGGTYSDSDTTANLATVFQQLADLLLVGKQYVLTYDATDSASVTVAVNYETFEVATDSRDYIACTP